MLILIVVLILALNEILRMRMTMGRILTLPRSAGLQPALDVAWHLDSCEKADYKSALQYFAGAVPRCALLRAD